MGPELSIHLTQPSGVLELQAATTIPGSLNGSFFVLFFFLSFFGNTRV
jgi:hypothetical protein